MDGVNKCILLQEVAEDVIDWQDYPIFCQEDMDEFFDISQADLDILTNILVKSDEDECKGTGNRTLTWLLNFNYYLCGFNVI